MWHGETWEFVRPSARDRVGDHQPDSTFTVDGCIFWTESEDSTDFQRNTVITRGTLAVPVAADVEPSDLPRSPTGEKFTIDGLGRWSQSHPLSRRSFGYRLFQVRAVT